MARVQIYLSAACGYCRAAMRLLESKRLEAIEAVRVDLEPGRRAEMESRSGRRTVPQIWIDERHVGGCDELYALERSGELDGLLALERT